MGVAKMRRRKMLAKKLEEEAEQSSPTTSTVDEALASGIKIAPKIPVIPVYMHILTIVLLFLAGLDVGIQQYHDDVIVHSEFAVKEYGIPFVQRKPWQPLTPLEVGGDSNKDAKRALEEEFMASSTTTNEKIQPKGVDKDEFDDDKEDEEYIPNIDPIFRVDLDEMTRGPGIFYSLARGAVAVHRMILYLVYYTPISIFNTLLSIPMALMKMPPALFLIALILRQIVGKIILGADIPEAKPDESAEKNNLEVISMAKNFVKSFLTTNFPTAYALYDGLVHLRSDMYIVICGVFCGMAWSHLSLPSTDGESLL